MASNRQRFGKYNSDRGLRKNDTPAGSTPPHPPRTSWVGSCGAGKSPASISPINEHGTVDEEYLLEKLQENISSAGKSMLSALERYAKERATPIGKDDEQLTGAQMQKRLERAANVGHNLIEEVGILKEHASRQGYSKELINIVVAEGLRRLAEGEKHEQ